jgi:protein-S-isoprenylcysteine O-methyltransferase Ste14
MNLKNKWIDILYNVATGSRKIRNFFTPVGALIYGLLIFTFVVIALQVDKLLGLTALFPNPFHIILSLPLLLLALFLIGWSVLYFLRVKGTPVPFNPPPQLVTTGPYAYTRNPMLTGVFALLFGFGVLFGSVSLLLVFTPLFIYINYWELKSIEEPELEKRLGEEYIEYRKRTPMFFPGLGIILKRRK